MLLLIFAEDKCVYVKMSCPFIVPGIISLFFLIVLFSPLLQVYVGSSVRHLNATFSAFSFVQESTMACTAARDAKASLRGRSVRI